MPDLFLRIATEAALESGAMIRKSVGRTGKISYKGRINIVTDVDRRSEDLIIKKVRKAFPGHSILSEEGPPRIGRSPYRWVIDPLDGTTNFAHSFPFFSVSVALEEEGDVILGVVYDPMREELFTAVKNEGSFLNKKRISASRTPALRRSLLATGFSYGVREKKETNIENFKNFLMRAQGIRRAGSAALDLCYVACGRFDGFWELDLRPWDSAAGCLIVREAKGIVTRFDGTRYSHYDKDVLATNGRIHRAMVKILKCR
ncbi:MAG: inositol monophosphatase family protein [Candidatus Omnitrophota bacterium]